MKINLIGPIYQLTELDKSVQKEPRSLNIGIGVRASLLCRARLRNHQIAISPWTTHQNSCRSTESMERAKHAARYRPLEQAARNRISPVGTPRSAVLANSRPASHKMSSVLLHLPERRHQSKEIEMSPGLDLVALQRIDDGQVQVPSSSWQPCLTVPLQSWKVHW